MSSKLRKKRLRVRRLRRKKRLAIRNRAGQPKRRRVAIKHDPNDLGIVLSRLPLRYATPIYMADHSLSPDSPRPSDPKKKNAMNGTGTLIAIGDRRYCVTNTHVLNDYRERKKMESDLAFQIGNHHVNPDEILVSESAEREFDLAVLDVTGVSIEQLSIAGEVPTGFIEIVSFPPTIPSPGGFVIFGGYPGSGRKEQGPKNIEYNTCGSGGTLVHEAREDNIVCRLELDKCEIRNLAGGPLTLDDMGGMSGGPVLIERRSTNGVSSFELVGFIYEYSKNLDVLYIRPAALINEDGAISRYPVLP